MSAKAAPTEIERQTLVQLGENQAKVETRAE